MVKCGKSHFSSDMEFLELIKTLTVALTVASQTTQTLVIVAMLQLSQRENPSEIIFSLKIFHKCLCLSFKSKKL